MMAAKDKSRKKSNELRPILFLPVCWRNWKKYINNQINNSNDNNKIIKILR